MKDMNWIKTSERTPEEKQWVLAYLRDTGTKKARIHHTGDGKTQWEIEYLGYCTASFTHWQYLPENPDDIAFFNFWGVHKETAIKISGSEELIFNR